MLRYVLANDKGKYITIDKTTNKYKAVSDIDEALRWKTEQAANNVWVNQLFKFKAFENQFFFPLEVYEAETLDEEEQKIVEEEILGEDDGDKYLNKEPFELEELEKNIKILNGSIKLIMNILSAKKKLGEQLEDVEREIVDIHHYMEFNKLPANQGYQAYKMLRERLLLRRTLKDMRYIYDWFKTNKITYAQLEELNGLIEGLETREYTPRRMTDLFENGIPKKTKVPKTEEKVVETVEEIEKEETPAMDEFFLDNIPVAEPVNQEDIE